MTPDRWERLQKVYFDAIALAEVERASYLEEVCGGDTELQDEIRALLHCQQKVDTFLESTAIDALTVAYHAQIIDDTETLESSEAVDSFIGRVVDERYFVTKFVGSGGMGSVYRADHRLLGSAVAIKRLAPHFRDHFEHRVRFIEEARRAVLLDHENVARVIDVVEESNEVLVVMEFIDGKTLRDSGGPIPELDEFLQIAEQCAAALVTAHSKDIAHLDLKPENIMLTSAGKVKICDFGMARDFKTGDDTRKWSKWAFGGTPAYMAPEVLQSDNFDDRADVFSLGVIFYELLSGQHPFRSADVQTTTKRIMHEAAPTVTANKALPKRLARLVDRMLEKDPEKRPAAAEVLGELESISRSRRYLKRVWSDGGEFFSQIPRSLIAACVVLFVVVATAGFMYFENIRTALGWAPLPTDKVVVVLPFEVIGEPPPEKRFYSDGLWEVVTIRLGALTSVPNLTVPSPSVILAPIVPGTENTIDSVEEAHGELGATIVVRGTLQFFGSDARYTFRLIDAGNERDLRHGSHTLPFADALALQDSIAEEIAAALEIELAPDPGWGSASPEALRLYTEGRGAVREDVDLGIERFQQAVKADPGYAAGFAALGLAYWQKFDPSTEQTALLEEATTACTRAYELDPKLSDAQVCLGRIHESKGDYELAVDYYRRATQYSATSEAAYSGLGSALGKLNRFEEAEKAYLRAVELAPDDWVPHSWIASFYNDRSDFANAVKHFSAAINLSKGNGKLYYSISNAYLNYGQYDLAIASLKESIRKRPYLAPPYSNLGVAYLRWRKYNEAIGPLEEAMSLAPEDYRITGNVARIYRLTGQVEKARNLYERAIEQARNGLSTNRRPSDVFILMGRYYAMFGSRTDAVSAIHQALKLRPDDPHYLLIAATAYTVLGDTRRALELTERAVELGYGSIQILAEPELDALAAEPRYAKLVRSAD